MSRHRVRNKQFWVNISGGIAVMFGLAAPVIALGAAATVEYARLVARRSQLQKAVDSAALAATQGLRLSSSTASSVDGIAKTMVAANAPTPEGNYTYVETSVLDQRTSVKVVVRETVGTVLGKLLSMPTMDIGVSSAAKLSGTRKLCLLTLDVSKDKALHLDKGSSVTANGCAIYSNSSDKTGLSIKENARASASLICSAGGVEQKSGSTVTPVATADCPRISDPLASQMRPAVGGCSFTKLKVTSSQALYPGTYCGGLEIAGTGQATMAPGIYIFDDGPLIVSGNASLSGQNVGLYFTGDKGGLRFDPLSTINLTAPKSGLLAGILMFEDRSVGAPIPPPPGPKGSPVPPPYGSQPMRQYQITSDNAPNLLGTIYLPAGRLIIDATRPVADKSAYTVIVARQLELNSGPNLYLNSDYDSTDIPVPQGVGPNSGNVSLSQ